LDSTSPGSCELGGRRPDDPLLVDPDQLVDASDLRRVVGDERLERARRLLERRVARGVGGEERLGPRDDEPALAGLGVDDRLAQLVGLSDHLLRVVDRSRRVQTRGKGREQQHGEGEQDLGSNLYVGSSLTTSVELANRASMSRTPSRSSVTPRTVTRAASGVPASAGPIAAAGTRRTSGASSTLMPIVRPAPKTNTTVTGPSAASPSGSVR